MGAAFGVARAVSWWGIKPTPSIKWEEDFHKALEKSKVTDKPILVLIMKDWCPTCTRLLPKYTKDTEIVDHSRNFIMVKCSDDKVAKSECFSPDGMYIPRIIFANNKGQVMTQFKNVNCKKKYKYFYPTTHDVVNTMKLVQTYYNLLNKKS